MEEKNSSYKLDNKKLVQKTKDKNKASSKNEVSFSETKTEVEAQVKVENQVEASSNNLQTEACEEKVWAEKVAEQEVLEDREETNQEESSTQKTEGAIKLIAEAQNEDGSFSYAYSSHVLTKEEILADEALEKDSIDLKSVNFYEVQNNTARSYKGRACLILALFALVLSVVDSIFGVVVSIVAVIFSLAKLNTKKTQTAVWAFNIGIIAFIISLVLLIF